MKPYGNELNLKKEVSYESKKNSEKISIINIKLIHQIIDTINISLLVLICILFFLSFNSQRKWSNTCLLYTSPSPRDPIGSRMPSSA